MSEKTYAVRTYLSNSVRDEAVSAVEIQTRLAKVGARMSRDKGTFSSLCWNVKPENGTGLLEDLGITVAEFATRVDVSRDTIYNYASIDPGLRDSLADGAALGVIRYLSAKIKAGVLTVDEADELCGLNITQLRERFKPAESSDESDESEKSEKSESKKSVFEVVKGLIGQLSVRQMKQVITMLQVAIDAAAKK